MNKTADERLAERLSITVEDLIEFRNAARQYWSIIAHDVMETAGGKYPSDSVIVEVVLDQVDAMLDLCGKSTCHIHISDKLREVLLDRGRHYTAKKEALKGEVG